MDQGFLIPDFFLKMAEGLLRMANDFLRMAHGFLRMDQDLWIRALEGWTLFFLRITKILRMAKCFLKDGSRFMDPGVRC